MGVCCPSPGVFQRWFLYPPDKTPHFHPNETTLAWLHHTYPALPLAERPLECTLRPGEVSPASLHLRVTLPPIGKGKAEGTPTQPCQHPGAVGGGRVTPQQPMESPSGRSCTSPTVGGTPRSTWTPASSSPPSWGRARMPEDMLLSSRLW